MATDSKQKPGSPFITPARLRELYGMMLRFQAAESDTRKLFKLKKWPSTRLPSLAHPAMLAACFAHLRAGDSVAPASYAFAANLAAGAALVHVLQQMAIQQTEAARQSSALTSAESVALISGAAQAVALAGQHAAVVAVLEDAVVLDDSVAPLLRWSARKQLPLIMLTVSREFPQPGDVRADHGVPQIAVGLEDAPAIYRVMQESIHRARTGIGPTWIRCVAARAKRPGADPLLAMQTFLQTRGYYDATQSRRESLAWAAAWKAAQKQVFGNPGPTSHDLPVRAFEPFR